MPIFRFIGNYQTYVGLPDGSERLTNPGDVVTLSFTSPGPLWVPAGTLEQVQVTLTAGITVSPGAAYLTPTVANSTYGTLVGNAATYAPKSVIGGPLPTTSNPLLGGSDLLIGANVVPTPTQVGLGARQVWGVFWQDIINGGTVSMPWLTQQVQALKSSATKASSIRIMGNNGGIQRGFYTRAQYIAGWQTVSDYCRGQGVTIYAALSGASWVDFQTSSDSVGAWPTSNDVNDLAAVALALSRMGNIVGLDVVQEFNSGLPAGATVNDAHTQLATIFTAIRATGCPISLTSSSTVFSVFGWDDAGFADFVATAKPDHLDVHVYYALPQGNAGTFPLPPHLAQVFDLIPTFTNLPVLFGEVGIPVSASSADRTAYFAAITNMLSGGRIAGAYAWSVADQSVAGYNYGLYSGSPGGTLTARTDVTVPFLAWPRRKQSTAMKRYSSVDQTIAVGQSTLTLDLVDHDHGGLGRGNAVTIPFGMGGVYPITMSIAMYPTAQGSFGAGTFAADGAFNIGLYNASNAIVGPQLAGNIRSGEGPKSEVVSGSVNLPDGFVGSVEINATLQFKVAANASMTFFSIGPVDTTRN